MSTMQNTQKAVYPLIHPLKNVQLGESFTSLLEGSGIYVRDENGKPYIDGISGLWNVSLGYGHPGIRQAILEQLDRIPFVNLVDQTNPTTVKFAQELLALTPERLSRAIYTCTGSESAELAIKLMRKYQSLRGLEQKQNIVALSISYHGTYYGAMSASGIDREISRGYGPKVPGFLFHDTPFSSLERGSEDEELRAIEELFEREGDRIAGMIVEPIIGSGGTIPLPDAFLRKIRELCDLHGALLAFDEVATGMGRTGRMFAFEHSGAVPDILCLSKGINSGYLPLGAVLFSEAIYREFAAANLHIEHLSTQNGNPIACAAGLATIEALNQPGMLEHVSEMGELLRELLNEELADCPAFLETRGKGLMIGVALQDDLAGGVCMEAERLSALIGRLKQRGLIVYPFYTPGVTTGFHLYPPFIISAQEVSKIVGIIKKTLGGR
ncbi:daptide-type RiPP biosynthesis aminotransferase [Saccharibacillus endophyticus]|uniref:Aspartate aminotransferase family protein n=1 Tax=Saccharibacillus endophyticus TaxID=2060666 RepID=A0ABQ2A0S7_9BACL|nr:daptide-type RiPP biosynthesis aminotransferase [Saccharibacillus endophyticus]GGH82097.1 aspartate aminotransferase family protein [Saccharibacillus endophyticus]